MESAEHPNSARADSEDEFVWSDAANAPGLGATSSPSNQEGIEVGESGGSSHLPRQDASLPGMGATSSPRVAQESLEVGESGGSSHLPEGANALSAVSADSTWADEAFQVGESGGSVDLPQAGLVASVENVNSARSAHEDDEFVWSDAANAPGMGATSSPSNQEGIEVGESGGSSHLPRQDASLPGMGATSSPRVAQESLEVGESGGSSHLPEGANALSAVSADSTWADEAFQVGESGGSADLPQAGLGRSVENVDSARSANEDDEFVWSDAAHAPGLSAASSPRVQEGIEVGESGGSAHLAPEGSSQPGDMGGLPSDITATNRPRIASARGDIGGDDPVLERSGIFPRSPAPWAMGSGGSGGSGDGGYPQLDPGSTDEPAEHADEPINEGTVTNEEHLNQLAGEPGKGWNKNYGSFNGVKKTRVVFGLFVLLY